MTNTRLVLKLLILIIFERPYITSEHRLYFFVTHMLSIDSGHSFLMFLILTQLPATSDERAHRHGLAFAADL